MPTPVGVESENASPGSSRAGAFRSSRTIAASSTTASAISPALASGSDVTAAEEALAIAAQMKASRAPGKRALPCVVGRVPGSQRNAPSVSTAAMIATATKAPRQWP